MSEIAILGAGISGLGAAHRLHESGLRAVAYEKEVYHGGHCATFHHDGFIFDDGPHISFTGNERIQNLFAESVCNKYEIIQACANNYWKGHWIKHPAQCNLYGLPEDLLVDIFSDFVRAHDNNDNGNARDYEEWLVASYGETFARTFPMQYGLKYHTITADNMTCEWIGSRLYKPDLKEVLHGMISPTTPDVHYVSRFRYPSTGGFVSFLDLFAKRADLRLEHEVIELDTKNRYLHLQNGKAVPYDFIISSLPLPELIPMISGTPEDVIKASRKLACTTCVLVNIGINRDDISQAHWTYFYDHEFIFTRLSFPHMQSPKNVPLGTGSIQAEIYYSNKYRPMDCTPEECIEPVIADLRRCGLLREEDRILFSFASIIPYANVIFDLDRPQSLETVHGYLDDIGIFYCGRYGEWGYHWSDQSFITGENAARRVLDKMFRR